MSCVLDWNGEKFTEWDQIMLCKAKKRQPENLCNWLKAKKFTSWERNDFFLSQFCEIKRIFRFMHSFLVDTHKLYVFLCSLFIEVGKKKSFYINYGIMLPAAQYSVIRKWLLSFNSGNK